MNSVDVLRVFWRHRWLFLVVFLTTLAGGLWLISSKISKLQDEAKAQVESNIDGKDYQVYAAGVGVKKFESSLPALNKSIVLGLIDEFLRTQKLDSIINASGVYGQGENLQTTSIGFISQEVSLAKVIDMRQILPNSELIFLVYQASSKIQAQAIFDTLKQEISAIQAIASYQQYYKDLLHSYKSTLSSNHNQQPQSTANIAYLQDIAQNGLLLWIDPNEINKDKKDFGSLEQSKRIAGITPRRALVFVLLSALVLGSLGVFLLEFVRLNAKRICAK